MCKGLSVDDVGEGVEGHRVSGDAAGRALVLKPAISFKKSWGGYRRTTVDLEKRERTENAERREITNRTQERR